MDWRNAVSWAQALPAGPKFCLSVVIALLATTLIGVLWSKPKDFGQVTKVDPTAPAAAVAPPSVPTAGEGREVRPGNSIAQSGRNSVAVQGNSAPGGIIAGTYYAAPVTQQERENQATRLRAELRELAQFPERNDGAAGVTFLEQHSNTQLPIKVYAVLSRYYQATLDEVAPDGALTTFKRQYYSFQSAEVDFENRAMTAVGPLVDTHIRAGWAIYFNYFLLRSAGQSRADIEASGFFPNYGMTFDKAEALHERLSATAFGAEAKRRVRTLSDIQEAARALIADHS